MFSKIKTALSLTVTVLGVVGLSLGGCAAETSEPVGDENVGAADQALTADQCEYFDVNGTIQICHELGNGKFKILRLNEQACINAHGSHAADYVTSTDPASPLYDPTCQGNGCLPEDAPCDATLPCCDGSTCTNGTCVPSAPACPCAQFEDWVAPSWYELCVFYSHPDNTYAQIRLSRDVYLTASPLYGGFCSTPAHGVSNIGVEAAEACKADLIAFDQASLGLCAACYGDNPLCSGDSCYHWYGEPATVCE